MNNETIALILGIIGLLLVIDGAISLARFIVNLCKRSKKITISTDDVHFIRFGLAVLQTNYANLYENNGYDIDKDSHDKIVELRSKFNSIANQSSVIIEVK